MQPEQGKQCLGGDVAQMCKIIAFDGHSQSLKNHCKKQAAMARGSTTSQTPGSRSRASPSCRSGRTTRRDGTAVILTIAASVEAAARKALWEFHHGGKATATTSASGRTCNDSVAIAIKLAISSAAAFSQAG